MWYFKGESKHAQGESKHAQGESKHAQGELLGRKRERRVFTNFLLVEDEISSNKKWFFFHIETW
jgi:hypothetical protein